MLVVLALLLLYSASVTAQEPSYIELSTGWKLQKLNDPFTPSGKQCFDLSDSTFGVRIGGPVQNLDMRSSSLGWRSPDRDTAISGDLAIIKVGSIHLGIRVEYTELLFQHNAFRTSDSEILTQRHAQFGAGSMVLGKHIKNTDISVAFGTGFYSNRYWSTLAIRSTTEQSPLGTDQIPLKIVRLSVHGIRLAGIHSSANIRYLHLTDRPLLTTTNSELIGTIIADIPIMRISKHTLLLGVVTQLSHRTPELIGTTSFGSHIIWKIMQ